MYNCCREDARGEDSPQPGGLPKVGFDGRHRRGRVLCGAHPVPEPTPRAPLSRPSPRPKPRHISPVSDTVARRSAGSAGWLFMPKPVSEPYTAWVAPPRTVDHPSAFWAASRHQPQTLHAHKAPHHRATRAAILFPEASGHTQHQSLRPMHNFAAAPTAEQSNRCRCQQAAAGAAVVGSIQPSCGNHAAAATSWRRRGGSGILLRGRRQWQRGRDTGTGSDSDEDGPKVPSSHLLPRWMS